MLITGGAGFIGANFAHFAARQGVSHMVVLDKLSYAGNVLSLEPLLASGHLHLERADINEVETVRRILADHRPTCVVHFAAETHVDRSISGPDAFVFSNVLGTLRLLEEVHRYWQGLSVEEQGAFRFLHVSTDEVYGSLSAHDAPFTEGSRYAPNSPYAASKAGSDHLVRAFHQTYGLPVITSNCSNNYGPYQFPEKLIPLMISQALAGKALPVYGDGLNVRDWLFVEDHCAALWALIKQGVVGEVYNIGGEAERSNLDVVRQICRYLDVARPRGAGNYESLITFVPDRLGHDFRYAIDARKLQRQTAWQPTVSFEQGLVRTVDWYVTNEAWCESVRSGAYQRWVDEHYGGKAS